MRTLVTIFGPKPFEEMDRDDRVRACYQHCALKWVMSEPMTNQTVRERFGLPEAKAETASRIIRDTIRAKLVKAEDPESSSKRYAKYLPYWA